MYVNFGIFLVIPESNTALALPVVVQPKMQVNVTTPPKELISIMWLVKN